MKQPTDWRQWEVCRNCRFWQPSSKDCHRYPPARDLPPFPVTSQFDWCGEFKRKVEQEKRT